MIAASYWAPIHAYVCRRWGMPAEEARDLTQDFFVQALERELFHRYDPARSRLRTYIRLCVDSHVRNAYTAQRRVKRGGGAMHLSLDHASHLPAVNDAESDRWFEQEWMRALFADALRALEEECTKSGKLTQFRLLARYDIDEIDQPQRSSYAELGEAFGIPVTQVTNYLAWSRRRLRVLVLERLRAQCRDEEEFREEARLVLGVEA
jgi:RNA polymerase sigma-70 factor (ECF subfamily)